MATSSGTAVNVGEQVFMLTMDITYRAAFGTSSMVGQDEFIKILQEFSKLFGAFNIADFIPYLGWIDPQGINNRLVKARGSLDKFIDTIMDDHMQNKRKNDGEMDMVDELLTFFSDEAKVNESDDLQNSIKLTKDNIKAIIMVSKHWDSSYYIISHFICFNTFVFSKLFRNLNFNMRLYQLIYLSQFFYVNLVVLLLRTKIYIILLSIY